MNYDQWKTASPYDDDPEEDEDELIDIIRVEHRYDIFGRSFFSVVHLKGQTRFDNVTALDVTRELIHDSTSLATACRIALSVGRLLEVPVSLLDWDVPEPLEAQVPEEEECPY